jgi:hypothetical protein
MRKLATIFLLLAILPPSGIKTYGGPHPDELRRIEFTPAGYALAGYTTTENGEDGWFLLVDGKGEIRRERTYGGPGNERIFDLVRVEDGWVLAGYTTSQGSGWRDFWLVKTDPEGREEWENTYGTEFSDRAYAVLKVQGGYLLVGESDTPDRGWDAMVVRIDEKGTELWRKRFGGSENDSIRAVLPAKNGYLLIGYTNSKGAGGEDGWVVKMDANGEINWEKTFGGRWDERFYGGISTGDRFILVGYAYSPESRRDVYVVCMNEKGEEIWSRRFGGSYDEEGWAIRQEGEGFVVAGWTGSYGEGLSDAYLLKLDVSGKLEWSRTVGGKGEDFAYDVTKTGGDYVLVGSTCSWGEEGDGMLCFVQPPSRPFQFPPLLIGAVAVILAALTARGIVAWRRSRKVPD